jgi:hypothetical protein
MFLLLLRPWKILSLFFTTQSSAWWFGSKPAPRQQQVCLSLPLHLRHRLDGCPSVFANLSAHSPQWQWWQTRKKQSTIERPTLYINFLGQRLHNYALNTYYTKRNNEASNVSTQKGRRVTGIYGFTSLKFPKIMFQHCRRLINLLHGPALTVGLFFLHDVVLISVLPSSFCRGCGLEVATTICCISRHVRFLLASGYAEDTDLSIFWIITSCTIEI